MASIYVRCGNTQRANLKCNDTEQAYQITEEKHALRETRAGRRSGARSRITSRDVKPLFLLLRTNIPVTRMILLVALSCCCPRVIGYREQRFAIEPQDQVAVVGSRVTLPCRVENKAGQLQWTKDDFGLGTHRHLVGYDRYKMVGSDEEGDYSLDIREVTLDDDAQYQCQVSSGPRGQPPIRSRYARLSVLVAPDPPKILQGPFIEVVEDSEQVFECVSLGGKPPAEMTWVDGEGGVLSQNVVYTVQPMPDGRRFTARSILRLRPRRHHDKQHLTCQAQNTADRAYKSATIKLEVKYAPAVRMYLKSNIAGGRIFEGDKLRLGCEAEGNPSDFSYKWYLNNQIIPGNFTNELIITNLTRKYNDNTLKCEVYNSVGKSADSKILEVSYGPRFIVKPKNVEGESGATATLICAVDGNPTPETIWLRHENGRIVKVGQSSDLVIDVNEYTAGAYWCRASVNGFPPIEASATVFVKVCSSEKDKRNISGGDSVTFVPGDNGSDSDHERIKERVFNLNQIIPCDRRLRKRVKPPVNYAVIALMMTIVSGPRSAPNQHGRLKFRTPRSETIRPWQGIPRWEGDQNLTQKRLKKKWLSRVSSKRIPLTLDGGPPKIISNSTQYGIEGGRIQVECLAFSVPKPEYFLWTFDGREVKPHHQDYEFLEEALSEGLTKSTLMIREGRSNHFGTYNCTVQNPYGRDTSEIYLEPYKILPYLLIVSTAAVCITAVVSITVFIVLCRRRRRRRREKTSDDVDDVKKPDVTDIGKGDCGDKCNGDRCSNLSELKLELRQVEGTCDAELPNQSGCDYRIPAGLELPLAGLVSLPNSGLDEKYVKHPRYSTDFSDLTNNLHFKVSNQANGYVQYVDYSKEYLPPALNSDYAGSMTRSMGTDDPHKEIQSGYKLRQSNSNQAIAALGVQAIGPDVIPFTPGSLCGGTDVTYAATCGNPYLKNNDPKQVYKNSIKAESTSAPPPYYSLKNSAVHQAATAVIPPSACLSRIRGSVLNANNVGAQPQVLNSSPLSSSALYILPPPNHSSQSSQLIKCNGGQTTDGTHV